MRPEIKSNHATKKMSSVYSYKNNYKIRIFKYNLSFMWWLKVVSILLKYGIWMMKVQYKIQKKILIIFR